MVTKYGYNPSWFYRNTVSGLDPVQGSCNDCYLIAALGAVAWTCPGQIRIPDPSGNISVHFWDTGRLAWSNWFTAAKTESLPVDESGNLFGARSMDANETWPAVYEKLYALFRGVSPSDGGPDIAGNMPDGNALECLSALTGWKTVSLLTSSYSPDALWTALKPRTSGSKTMFPMVAWTYPNLPALQPGTAIMPKHSFPVLGIYTDAGGSNYLVLRNPRGSVTRNSGISMLDSGSWTFTETIFSAPGVAMAFPRPVPRTLSFNLGQGIFALAMKEVPAYFEGIGYVT
ncbi:MAG TPA: C2 family cysteine protease [Methanomicrobiales archaeon]|nr:C2 family cysteine protease [Methanomicrobiales archaeon]